jgi:hypothetical protein
MLCLMTPLRLFMLMKTPHNLSGTEFEEGVPPPLLSSEWLSPDEMETQDAKRWLSELRQGRKLYQDNHSKEAQEDSCCQPPLMPPTLPPVTPLPTSTAPPTGSDNTRETSKWSQSLITSV